MTHARTRWTGFWASELTVLLGVGSALAGCGEVDTTDAMTDAGSGGLASTDGTDAGPSTGSAASDGSPSDGSASGMTTGGTADGGSINPATGGAPGAGGQAAPATGGGSTFGPELMNPCSREYPLLEPPCSDSDIFGLWPSCGLWFEVPLADVTTPANNLQVVLLPLDPGSDADQPLPLEVILLVPDTTPPTLGETFELPGPAVLLRAAYPGTSAPPPAYFDDRTGKLGLEARWFGVARVALKQGPEILSEYRALIEATSECIK